MESSQFEKLEEKVEFALKVINDLNQSKHSLQKELEDANTKIRDLEAQNEELLRNVGELESSVTEKSSTMAEADQRIQNLITKLEAENLEAVLQ